MVTWEDGGVMMQLSPRGEEKERQERLVFSTACQAMMKNGMVTVIVVMALIQSLEDIELVVRENHYAW